MNTVWLNGIELAFEDIGSGSRVLLLIHGHPFDHTMWRPQFGPIARLGWRLLVPDLRGYGASGTSVSSGQTSTLEIFARDAIALLDHLGIEQAVVAGLSMGGQIAMEICRLAPARVRGIALAATFPQAETALGRQQRITAAERLVKEGMAGYAAETLTKMLAPRSACAPHDERSAPGRCRGRASGPRRAARLLGRPPALRSSSADRGRR